MFSVGYYITFKPTEFLRVHILGDLCTELLNVLVGTDRARKKAIGRRLGHYNKIPEYERKIIEAYGFPRAQ
jgi:hypothetical protein